MLKVWHETCSLSLKKYLQETPVFCKSIINREPKGWYGGRFHEL